MPIDDDDRHQPRPSSTSPAGRRPITDDAAPQLRRAVVHRRHRQVEQRRRDQDRPPRRHRAPEPIRRRCTASASRCRPTSPARAPASSGATTSGPRARSPRCRWAIRSASRRCRWWRRSARSPTAASYIEPRVIRAVYRDNRRYAGGAEGRAPHDQRRHRGDADDDHGRRSSTDGTAQARADRRLHHRRQDRHRREAGQRPLLARPTTTRRSSASCRRSNPAVAIIVVIDSPQRAERHTAASVSAPVFKRIAEATLRYLGVPPTVESAAAGAGRAHDETPADADRRRQRHRRRSSAWSPTAPPGTVPDLRGMSARDAMQHARAARHDRAHVGRRLRRVAGCRRPASPIDGDARLPSDARALAVAACWRARAVQ